MEPEQSELREPVEAREALRAWARGDIARGRELYRVCIAKADLSGAVLSSTFYLAEWARHEAEIGNSAAFEDLYRRVFELEPNAPFWRLCYARDTWTVLGDSDSCARRLEELEELLASDRWDKTQDLSLKAYEAKIETLRAWTRGEPGGPITP